MNQSPGQPTLEEIQGAISQDMAMKFCKLMTAEIMKDWKCIPPHEWRASATLWPRSPLKPGRGAATDRPEAQFETSAQNRLLCSSGALPLILASSLRSQKSTPIGDNWTKEQKRFVHLRTERGLHTNFGRETWAQERKRFIRRLLQIYPEASNSVVPEVNQLVEAMRKKQV